MFEVEVSKKFGIYSILLSSETEWRHILRKELQKSKVEVSRKKANGIIDTFTNGSCGIRVGNLNLYYTQVRNQKVNQRSFSTSVTNKAFNANTTGSCDNSLETMQNLQTALGEKPIIQSVISSNGEIRKSSLNSQDFLKNYPRGPYTTCRTIEHKSFVFMLDQHIYRLCKSYNLMFNKVLNESNLYSQVKKQIEIACSQFVNKTQDLKITILLTENVDIYLHLVEYDSDTVIRDYVNIDIASGGRKEMLAKDSIWVQKMRDSLLNSKHKDSEEVIMCEDDGTLREGVSSNVFAVISTSEEEYSLLTAVEGIIPGTVRKLVLQVVHDQKVFDNEGKRINISFLERDINIRDIQHIKELFITSTSRLVMPVSKAYIAADIVKKYNLPQEVIFNVRCPYFDSISHSLHVAVTKELIASSDQLCEAGMSKIPEQ